MNLSPIPDDWHHAPHISFGEVRRRLEDATSLSERSAILAFIEINLDRIRPAVDDDWLYDAKSGYLLDCIAQQDPTRADDDSSHTPFEAARDLVAWFQWFVAREVSNAAIRLRVDRIAAVLKRGDPSVKNCLETGFLEHLLETPQNRAYFKHWKNDDQLAESYAEALRWGEAHTKPFGPQS